MQSDKAVRSTRERLWRWVLITRADDQPYLWRLRLVSSRWFGIYLHRFAASDDICLHDHPWPFISIVLTGGYLEHSAHGPLGETEACYYRPGSVLFRPARWSHRIEVDPARVVRTLVIRGRRSRDWGFSTWKGWIPWQRYSHSEHCE